MIAVAVASEANMAKLEENRARLAKLADPRTINMDDAHAEALVQRRCRFTTSPAPFTRRKPGSPTALMELAYRLAVDDHEYIKVDSQQPGHADHAGRRGGWPQQDGRHLQVAPRQPGPATGRRLVYWGKYVAHDNNRDAMGVTLKLTENVLNTYKQWNPQVLHDLHESVPYLYDNTVGDGPYNAWIDPILADEWQMIGWNNVAEMTKFGMPGVFTHGNFDTWSPGYLMFIAALHNGISRLYETFGNGGADTVERTLSPNEYARTWYRQNPPLPKTMWSQRNNNNYQQTGLLTALHYFAGNGKLFLRNFYIKSKRSVLKPRDRGSRRVRVPGDERAARRAGRPAARPAEAGRRDLPRDGGVHGDTAGEETARATGSTTTDGQDTRAATPDGGPSAGTGRTRSRTSNPAARRRARFLPAHTSSGWISRTAASPTRCSTIRYLEPERSAAHAIRRHGLDVPRTVQRAGGARHRRQSARCRRMRRSRRRSRERRRSTGTGSVFLVNHNADNALATLRYKFKNASFEAAEEPFEAAGKKFSRGSFIITNVAAGDLEKAAADLGLQITAVESAPSVKTHPIPRPRVALCTRGRRRRPKAGGGRPSTSRRCRSRTSARRTSRKTTTSTRSST